MSIPLLFAFPPNLQVEDLLIENETPILLLASSQPTPVPVAHRSPRESIAATVGGLPISFWTLLRLLHSALPPAFDTPQVLGTDDFAWRKGDQYGTILVDLEAHLPIDLLPGRQAETFEVWPRAHPAGTVVSCDRASAYAECAKTGAPNALQVTDRYYVVANLRDVLQRLLDRDRRYLPSLHETESAAIPESADQTPAMEHRVQRAEAPRQVRRGKRYEHYQAVVELHRQELGERAIARQPGISRSTVRRYLEAGTFPEQRVRPKRRSLLDPYLPYLRERWGAGCQNAA